MQLQTDVHLALGEPHAVFNKHQTSYPEAFTTRGGDFNKANLMKSLPNFHQHVSCSTRGPNTLDHCYTTIKDAYRSIPCPHFGKYDHTAVLLLPAYRQQLKSALPEVRTVQSWSGEAEEQLQDCLESVDWAMFRDSATDLNEYATVATEFIKKCVEDCIPTKTFRVFPNQKPWMNHEIRILLKTRSRAFRSGDKRSTRRPDMTLVRPSKRPQGTCSKLGDETDVRQLWRGLNAYKAKSGGSSNVSEASLPDELNAFYARFDRENTDVPS
ncbi:uncharacterized protein LOC129709727 [Leucoraja erinacea]|uniref:uncharacterized protein LOC129709727 n=1 Tax=Leucoraja erinaceus TaxID=7782 RepID=UPI0024557960|nr:uncharacterized protein LOC129709727 [Leucoraja erinacea]